MIRDRLLKFAVRAKTIGGIDTLIRINPLLKRRIEAEIDAFATAGNLQTATEDCTAQALRAARLTRYGKGRSLDFSQWPILDKEKLRADPQAFVNHKVWPRIPSSTGGTSGIPLRLSRSLSSIVAEQVYIDRLLAPYGFSMLGSKVAVLRGDTVKPTSEIEPGFGRYSHGGRRLTLSSPHLGLATVGWYRKAMAEFKPDVFWIYPNAAVSFMRLMEMSGLSLEVPLILASSEMLTDENNMALRKFFGSKLINYYGQAERLCLAVSSTIGEFYFDPSYGRVELLPDDEPASQGQRRARIVATGYHCNAMPLVRYETGDAIEYSAQYGEADLPAIALGKLPFVKLAGRDGEFVLMRDGTRVVGLNQIAKDVPYLYQLQIIQTSFDSVNLNMLVAQGFDEAARARLMQQARAKIPGDVKIELYQVEELEKTSRGKAPLVLHPFLGE